MCVLGAGWRASARQGLSELRGAEGGGEQQRDDRLASSPKPAVGASLRAVGRASHAKREGLAAASGSSRLLA